jgi:metal-sulfur cluster biosynthetic enzyme
MMEEAGMMNEAPRAAGATHPGLAPRTPLDGTQVMDALRQVIDPEVGIDIVTMGLVYDVHVDDDAVTITYTLTTPGCPLAEYIRAAIHHAAEPVLGGRTLSTYVVWEPRWTPDRIDGGAW